MHSTNYRNTFIEIAEDSTLVAAKEPLAKNENPTIARMQYERIAPNPYKYTSDDVIFDVYCARHQKEANEANRQAFFSKGQPCFRTSPLAKTHGFGFHFDENENVAIYAVESEDYARFQSDPSLQHVKAMRTKRA